MRLLHDFWHVDGNMNGVIFLGVFFFVLEFVLQSCACIGLDLGSNRSCSQHKSIHFVHYLYGSYLYSFGAHFAFYL